MCPETSGGSCLEHLTPGRSQLHCVPTWCAQARVGQGEVAPPEQQSTHNRLP